MSWNGVFVRSFRQSIFRINVALWVWPLNNCSWLSLCFYVYSIADLWTTHPVQLFQWEMHQCQVALWLRYVPTENLQQCFLNNHQGFNKNKQLWGQNTWGQELKNTELLTVHLTCTLYNPQHWNQPQSHYVTIVVRRTTLFTHYAHHVISTWIFG